MRVERGSLHSVIVLAVLALLVSWAPPGGAAQGKPKMISGHVSRIYAGFLEVQTDPKNVAIVKVNASTVYWNGKTDKKGTAKDLRPWLEVIIEATENNGVVTAQKIRFMPAGE